METLLFELVNLVTVGDFCGRKMSRNVVNAKIKRSLDLYRQGSFSFEEAVKSDVSLRVYIGGCNDAYAYKKMATLPVTTDHLCRDLKITKDDNFIDYILDTASTNDVEDPVQLDQCVWHLPSYSCKLSFDRSEAYAYPFEVWGQAGSRKTPMHVGHGRSVGFLPPCLENAFKVWFYRNASNPESCFVIQRPGDIVYASNLVHHGVILGYKAGTREEDKWAAIAGNVIVTANDAGDALRYMSNCTIGTAKGSEKACKRLLPAFAHMRGQEWREDRFEEEKEGVLRKRAEEDKLFVSRSVSAQARYSKKRKRADKLVAARAAINKSE
ncbi:Hypothetical protein PHPALM_3267 [Phytophthora palmivora]|uniref:Uncharacterized protein n=1 Tax=Phytophthora palmivora TaxID=4796 RepID=A0A2P4YMV9_9STRA|nr:Hypothetical protein PHPALM_3267 [Phytophthora palmivora]